MLASLCVERGSFRDDRWLEMFLACIEVDMSSQALRTHPIQRRQAGVSIELRLLLCFNKTWIHHRFLSTAQWLKVPSKCLIFTHFEPLWVLKVHTQRLSQKLNHFGYQMSKEIFGFYLHLVDTQRSLWWVTFFSKLLLASCDTSYCRLSHKD